MYIKILAIVVQNGFVCEYYYVRQYLVDGHRSYRLLLPTLLVVEIAFNVAQFVAQTYCRVRKFHTL